MSKGSDDAEFDRLFGVSATRMTAQPAAPQDRSDISFERAMEIGRLILELHERGLTLSEKDVSKDRAHDWMENRKDYVSACSMGAAILAVKLRDALAANKALVEALGALLLNIYARPDIQALMGPHEKSIYEAGRAALAAAQAQGKE